MSKDKYGDAVYFSYRQQIPRPRQWTIRPAWPKEDISYFSGPYTIKNTSMDHTVTLAGLFHHDYGEDHFIESLLQSD